MAGEAKKAKGGEVKAEEEDQKPTVVLDLNALKAEFKADHAGDNQTFSGLKFNTLDSQSSDETSEPPAGGKETDLDAIFDNTLNLKKAKSSGGGGLELSLGEIDLSGADEMPLAEEAAGPEEIEVKVEEAAEGTLETSPDSEFSLGEEIPQEGLDLGGKVENEEFPVEKGPAEANQDQAFTGTAEGDGLQLNVSLEESGDFDLEVAARSTETPVVEKAEGLEELGNLDELSGLDGLEGMEGLEALEDSGKHEAVLASILEPEPEPEPGPEPETEPESVEGPDGNPMEEFSFNTNEGESSDERFLPVAEEAKANSTRTFEFNKPTREELNALPDPEDSGGFAAADTGSDEGLVFQSESSSPEAASFGDFLAKPKTEQTGQIVNKPEEKRESTREISPAPSSFSPSPQTQQKQAHQETQEFSSGNLASLSRANEEYMAYHENELIKLSAIIRNLREDREQLLKKIETLDTERGKLYQDNISFKAELDEVKIELALARRRNSEDADNLRYQLRLSQTRRDILEEQNKNYQTEFLRLREKVKVDFRKIKEREKELENQLDLLRSDGQIQITTRDRKIMDLQRQIESMEFDMENMVQNDRRVKENQMVLQDKLERVMKTLQTGIGLLGQDEEMEMENPQLLKKIKF